MENSETRRERRQRVVLPLYVGLVAATGGFILGRSLTELVHAPRPLEWLVFAVLAIGIGSFPISVASAKSSISVSDTFFISAALLFGPAPAAVAIAVDSLILSLRKHHKLQTVAFNAVAPSLSMWVAAKAFFISGNLQPLSTNPAAIGRVLMPLVSLTVVYFVVNSGLTAVAVGLETGKSPLRLWWHHFMWLLVGYLASSSVALCLIVIYQEVGAVAVAVVLPVLAVFHLTVRANFGRLDDAERHVTEMNRLYTSTIETLAMAIDAKDDVTHSHVRRVQAYAVALARELGVGDETSLKAIEAAALLHDTGKLAVPEHILNKPGKLTPAEFEQMKRHVDIGSDILSLVDFPYPVVPIVRCHHENWDGTGYPRGIVGADIPVGARILSVVDCFDALISDRPYRKRLSDEAALDILRERRGNMYDPAVVDAFIRIHADISLAGIERPDQRQVLEQISQSHRAPEQMPAIAPLPTVTSASEELLAFVSIARLAGGAATVADVLALSSGLIRSIVPDASGVWFMLNASGDRLVVADGFGSAHSTLRHVTIRVGERLSGWVAANKQVILNSDPALDFGDLAQFVDPPLKSCLSVPLANGDTLRGVLSLYASGSSAFSEDQGRLMQMIASQVAQALDVARRSADEPQFRSSRDLRLVSN